MYKIAALCAMAIGIPHYLLAEKAQVICEKDGEEVGILFEGKFISVDKNLKSKIYSPAELTRRCQDLSLSELKEGFEDEDHNDSEDDDRKVIAVLKRGS